MAAKALIQAARAGLKVARDGVQAARGKIAASARLAARLAKENVPMDGGARLIPVHAIPQSRRLRAAYLGEGAAASVATPPPRGRAAREAAQAAVAPEARVPEQAEQQEALTRGEEPPPRPLQLRAPPKDDSRPVDLVADCIEAKDGAWERFVSRYAPLIHAIARRSLRSRGLSPAPDDLDDICENTLLALVKDDFALLRSYDDRFALSTFVGVVARTQAGRFARRRRVGGSDVDVAELPSRCEDPATAVEEGDLRAALRETLDEMPDRDRKILHLFYFSDRDYREIATELKISANSVGAALHRARERLRVRLEARGQG